jgi:hypothetical protein
VKDFNIDGKDNWSFPTGGDTFFGVKAIRTQDDWNDLWNDNPPGPLPKGAMAVVVSLGAYNYGPWSLGIQGVHEEDDRLVVDYTSRGPAGAAMARDFQPVAIKLVEDSDKAIELNNVTPPDRNRHLRPSAGRPPAP